MFQLRIHFLRFLDDVIKCKLCIVYCASSNWNKKRAFFDQIQSILLFHPIDIEANFIYFIYLFIYLFIMLRPSKLHSHMVIREKKVKGTRYNIQGV